MREHKQSRIILSLLLGLLLLACLADLCLCSLKTICMRE